MKHLVGGILLKNQQILLGRRSPQREYYPDVWDLIGGHCLAGESFEKALFRELAEETGVVPTGYRLLEHIDCSPAFILEVYLITRWIGQVENRSPEEHSELAWFTVDQASQLPLADQRYIGLFRTIVSGEGPDQ